MTEQLSDEEIEAVRGLVKADQRRQWLLSGIRSVSIWLVGVLAAWGAIKTALAEVFK